MTYIAGQTDRAYITGSDAQFFPLLKGLVLSLIESGEHPSTVSVLDGGLLPSQVDWLHAAEINVLQPRLSDYYSPEELQITSSKHFTQLTRPLLPSIVEHGEHLIWLDADTWIQDPSSLHELSGAIGLDASACAAHPSVDATYGCTRSHWVERRSVYRKVNSEILGEDKAAELDGTPVLNSGVFAANRASPLWGNWEETLRTSISKAIGQGRGLHHLAEQAAFNQVVYLGGEIRLVPLDARFNYQCHSGNAVRDDDSNRVRTSGPAPWEPFIIHLVASRANWRTYFDRGLLYGRGQYMTADEVLIFLAD